LVVEELINENIKLKNLIKLFIKQYADISNANNMNNNFCHCISKDLNLREFQI